MSLINYVKMKDDQLLLLLDHPTTITRRTFNYRTIYDRVISGCTYEDIADLFDTTGKSLIYAHIVNGNAFDEVTNELLVKDTNLPDQFLGVFDGIQGLRREYPEIFI